MEPLEAKAADFVRTNGLFAEARRILLAVSGGADSTALLHVMKALTSNGTIRADLVCVHVNHHLRGPESDGDENFLVERAAELGLRIVSRSVDVGAYAEEHKLSLETAGRRVRLACFAEVARVYDCTWIATGHQKNDNAETVLQRLRRGTGLRGLGAIWPARRLEGDLWLARPLLGSTRAEIITYLQAGNLRWREDHTNADCTYTRNHVRHRLLPALQSRSAGPLVEELTELAASARKLHQRVGAEAGRAASESVTWTDGAASLDTTALAALSPMVAVELIRLQLPRLACGERELTQNHYESILRLARQQPARRALTLPGGVSIRTESGNLILQRRRPPNGAGRDDRRVTLDVPGTVTFDEYTVEAKTLASSEVETLKIKGDKGPFLEYLDLDRVGRPLVVRRRRPGDRFRPLGLAHEKKLGKFLTAAKVRETMREKTLVFDDGEKIVWVCPVRISEHAKVANETKRVLMLRVSERHCKGAKT